MKTKNNKVINTDILLQAETKDALLHAINEEYVEAVEVLLDHEESIHLEGEPWSWETLSEEEAVFSTDMTPLVLAAHTNNYEIIKILLDRGAGLPCPHHHRSAQHPHLPSTTSRLVREKFQYSKYKN